MAKIRTLPVVPGPANPPLLSKQHRHQPNVLDLLWGKTIKKGLVLFLYLQMPLTLSYSLRGEQRFDRPENSDIEFYFVIFLLLDYLTLILV